MDRTITVLTLDLPIALSERLRRAGDERGASLRDIAIEALKEWLERHEAEGGEHRAKS